MNKGPGKIRIQLSEALSRIGIHVEPENILRNHDTRGPGSQAVRWEARGWRATKLFRVRFRVYSWDTMKDCVKFGVVLHKLDCSYEGEVSADEKA